MGHLVASTVALIFQDVGGRQLVEGYGKVVGGSSYSSRQQCIQCCQFAFINSMGLCESCQERFDED